MPFTQKRREATVKLADIYNWLAKLVMHDDREMIIPGFQAKQCVWTALLTKITAGRVGHYQVN